MLAFFTTDAAVDAAPAAPRAARGGGREPEPHHRGRRHLHQRHGGGPGQRRRCPRAPSWRRAGTTTRSAPRSPRPRARIAGDDRARRRGRDARGRGPRGGRPPGGARPTASPARWPSRRWSRRRCTAATPTGAASSPRWAAPGVELDIGRRGHLFLGDVWVAEGGRARAYDEARGPPRHARGPRAHPRPPHDGAAVGLDVDLRPLPRLRRHQRALPELRGRPMKLWGGNYAGGSGPASSGSSTARSLSTGGCWREEIARLAGLRAGAGALRRAPRRRRRARSTRRWRECLAQAQADPAYLDARRRGRPQLRGDAADARSWATWPARRTSAAAATSRR